jgi:hypothetical protein
MTADWTLSEERAECCRDSRDEGREDVEVEKSGETPAEGVMQATSPKKVEEEETSLGKLEIRPCEMRKRHCSTE